jgi:hypothetical protein
MFVVCGGGEAVAACRAALPRTARVVAAGDGAAAAGEPVGCIICWCDGAREGCAAGSSAGRIGVVRVCTSAEGDGGSTGTDAVAVRADALAAELWRASTTARLDAAWRTLGWWTAGLADDERLLLRHALTGPTALLTVGALARVVDRSWSGFHRWWECTGLAARWSRPKALVDAALRWRVQHARHLGASVAEAAESAGISVRTHWRLRRRTPHGPRDLFELAGVGDVVARTAADYYRTLHAPKESGHIGGVRAAQPR